MNNIKTFDAGKINWINNNGRVDASELGLNVGEVPYTIQTNKVDNLMLKLVNNKKGTECFFRLQKIINGALQQNYSREVLCWQFESLDGKILLDIFNH